MLKTNKGAIIPPPRKVVNSHGGIFSGFTLAETLITLMVIGVVAVLTIPALTTQVNEYILQKQKDVFSKKWAEGLRQMRVDGKLETKYASTADFVSEMQKYFKIASICDKDNLTSCFTTESFTYHDDITDLSFTTADLKTTQNIASVTGHNLGYTADVMGVVLSDGAQILITVNPDCTGIASGDTQGNLEQCFAYIANVNGIKSPNAVEKDIVSNINMSALDFEIASVGAVGSNTFGNTGEENYWLEAKRYCESLDEDGGNWHLPDANELTQIANILYKNADCERIETKNGQPGYYTCNSTKVTSSNMWTTIGASSNGYIILWANLSHDEYRAYYRGFGSDSSDYDFNYISYSENIHALCVR